MADAVPDGVIRTAVAEERAHRRPPKVAMLVARFPKVTETFQLREMVALEPLSAEDLQLVRSMVHRHYERTMSQLAWRVLSGWKKESQRFVKVMPTEYRRVLGASASAARIA